MVIKSLGLIGEAHGDLGLIQDDYTQDNYACHWIQVYDVNLVMVFQLNEVGDFYYPDKDYDEVPDGVLMVFDGVLMVFTNNIIKENLMSGQQMFKQ